MENNTKIETYEEKRDALLNRIHELKEYMKKCDGGKTAYHFKGDRECCNDYDNYCFGWYMRNERCHCGKKRVDLVADVNDFNNLINILTIKQLKYVKCWGGKYFSSMRIFDSDNKNIDYNYVSRGGLDNTIYFNIEAY